MDAFAFARALFFAALPALSLLFSPGANAESPRPVRVQTVELTPAEQTVTYSGIVQARILADLSFRVGGKVIERPVNVGDAVKAGQVIGQIDPTDLGLNFEADQQAVAAAVATESNARAEFERYAKLGIHSAAFLPSEFDKRQSAMMVAEARLAQAKRQLALAQDQLAYATLRADADGLITALPVQVGQVVNPGQSVASLAHIAKTEVAVDIPENRLAELREATEIIVIPWSDPAHSVHGQLREIGALADPASRTFTAKITLLDHPPGLALGMTVSVRISRPAGRPVVILPASALIGAADGRPAVWVLDPARQRATLRPVEIAAYRGDSALAIEAGLAPGEKVVTAGVTEIDADTPVTQWTGASR